MFARKLSPLVYVYVYVYIYITMNVYIKYCNITFHNIYCNHNKLYILPDFHTMSAVFGASEITII